MNLSRLRLASVVAFALLAAPAWAQADDPPELTRRDRGDLAIHARSILRQHCFECHNGNKKISSLPILEHAKLIATTNAVPFVAPKKVANSQIIHFIEDGSMPSGDRPRLSPDEISVLKKWIAEGAPSFPNAFDTAGTVQAISTDLASQPEETVKYLRYISFAHLVTDKGPLPNLKKAEFDLARALRVAGVTVPPQPVDDTATLFRFDLRTIGWDKRDLFVKRGGIFPLDIYDVLLLEYPYAAAVKDNDRLNQYFANANLVRPIPFLRADWVTQVLLNQKGEKHEPTPLALDLKSLGELSAALGKEGRPGIGREEKMPYGPKPRPFGGTHPVAAAPKPERASPILPVDSWYSGDVHADPPPFDVTVELIGVDGKPITSVATKKTPEFQLRVTAKHRMRYSLLMVQADGTIRVQETNKQGFFDQDQIILAPKQNTPFAITDISSGELKATEYFVLLVSDPDNLMPPFPSISLIQSRHAAQPDPKEPGRPVQRFLFPVEKFDSTKVVRKVIPIPLTSGKSE